MRDDVPVFDRVRPLIDFGRMVSYRYNAVGGSLVAAGLSFYVLFALAPTAVAVGALAGAFLTQEQMQDAITEVVERSPQSLQPLEPVLDSIAQLADRGSTGAFTATTVVSMLVAAFVAARVVYGLRATLTRVFGAHERAYGITTRVFSAVVALVGIIVMVVLLLALQLIPRLLSEFGIDSILQLAGPRVVSWTVLVLVGFAISAIAITYLPAIKPRVPIRSWGVLLATAWMVGSSAVFGLYTSLSSSVGAAVVVFGAPIVLMLWAYLIFVGLLIGGAIEAQRMGIPPPPQPEPTRLPTWLVATLSSIGVGSKSEESVEPRSG